MSCKNPEMEKLINLYQFGFLPDDRKAKVEAHLLECKECLKELYQMSPVLELLNNKPELFLESLKPHKTLATKISEWIKKPNQTMDKMKKGIQSFIAYWWKSSMIKILVPVAGIICMLFFLLLRSPKQYADLAIVEKLPYSTLRFKGPEELNPNQKIFESALKLYNRNKYSEAISKFHEYLLCEPENPHAHLYLGVTLFLINQLDSSLKHLEIAAQLSDMQDNELLLEKSYWYLGNACLKTNDEEKALIMFRNLLKLKGSFQEKSQKQLDRIIKMKNKKSRE